MDYRIKDEDWAIIFPILNEIKGLHTEAHENLRNFIEVVGYILRSRAQWRLLPESYGHLSKIYRRFKRWSDNGQWHIACSAEHERLSIRA